MSYSSFPLDIGPSYPVSQKKKPNVKTANFGDGYDQRVADGINSIKPTVTAEWDGLTRDESETLDAFFTDLGGVTPFMWQFPGEDSETEWVCTTWTKKQTKFNQFTIAVSFTRSFNP